MNDVTRIVEAIGQGDTKAADDLLALVYGELRKLAAHVARDLADQPEAQVEIRAMQRKLRGNEHPGLADSLNNLASALQSQGKLAES